MENVTLTLWRECPDDPLYMEQFDDSGPIGERVLATELEARRAREGVLLVTLKPWEDSE